MIPGVSANFLAVFAAAIVSMVVGFLWYSPMLFGNEWMKLLGIKMKDAKGMKEKAMKGYAITFVASIVMASVLAYVLKYAQASSVLDGLMTAFWLWLGFVVTVKIGMVLWEGKPFKLFLLDTGYYLVSLLAMGAVLGAMG